MSENKLQLPARLKHLVGVNTGRANALVREAIENGVIKKLGGYRRIRAVLCFCVQHTGVNRVQPADEIDPEYGRLLRLANATGVELIAYGANIDTDLSVIELTRELMVELPI